MLPILIYAPIEVYFIDSVLKYKFKNRKLTYFIAAILSVVASVVAIFTCIDENGKISVSERYTD